MGATDRKMVVGHLSILVPGAASMREGLEFQGQTNDPFPSVQIIDVLITYYFYRFIKPDILNTLLA